MKYTFAICMLISSCFGYTYGADLDIEKCQEIYLSVHKAEGKVSALQASEFLNSISCEYFSTAEGGEFGSELIIKVLENSTNEFIVAFDRLNPSLQEVVLDQVKEPIHDGFNLQNIYNNINKTKTSSQTKQKLLAAIKQAAKGQFTELQQ